jgi:D-sedoheptulose 7-phosphate isomerase
MPDPSPADLLRWIDKYVAAQDQALRSVDPARIAAVIEVVKRAGRAGRRIFVCGNGGNAANAAHFATDLGKNASAAAPRAFKVLSVADNVSWMTAIGNDFAFEDVFQRQLANHAERGDLLIVTSVSGDSLNLVAACRWAREQGLETIGLVGGKRGAVAALVDHLLVVEDGHYGRVEDAQMNILHMICYSICELG